MAQSGIVLRRGVNVHHLFNWPEVQAGASFEYRWPPFKSDHFSLSDDEVRRLKASGFDFLRVTVDPAILMAQKPRRRDELAEQIADGVGRLTRGGLNVVVDLHPIKQNPAYPPDALARAGHEDLHERYRQAVVALAGALKTLPPAFVALELMNEPPIWKPEELAWWRTYQQRLHDVARQAAPRLPLVLTGGGWSGFRQLAELDVAPFRGSDVFYTFHYYEPHVFTHQGVDKEVERSVRSLAWPPAPGGLAAAKASLASPGRDRAEVEALLDAYFEPPFGVDKIKADFAAVRAWADKNAAPRERVLLGEFGAVRGEGVAASRLAWLEAVRREAEASGFAWAVWLYRGGGGMALAQDASPHRLDDADLRALGLTPPSEG